MNRTIVSSFAVLSLVTFTACGEEVVGTDTDTNPTDGMSTEGLEQPTLTVKVNLRQGGFQIIEIDGTVLRDMPADACAFEAGYHTCLFIGLDPGAYRITFHDVTGYQTPDFQLVQLDGQDDEVIGDYTKL